MIYELTTLGEYAKIQGGYAYKSADFLDIGNHPVLKIKNIRFGSIDYSDTAFISPDLAKNTDNWLTKEGDILISMTGSGPNAPNSLVGRSARVWKNEPQAWINQRVGRLILKSEGSIHSDFLFYLLNLPSSQQFLVSNSSGSANQANINGKTVELLSCPRINYRTSVTISKILRAFDEKIILNKQMNETLEGMAQAIFKSWFVDFDPVHAKAEAFKHGGSEEDARIAAMCAISGKTADALAQLKSENPDDYAQLATTADAFPSAFTDSDLGQIPEGWEVKRTEDLSSKIAMGPFGSNIKVSTFVDSGVPIISGQHLHETLLNDGDNNFITTEHAQKLSNCNVFAMDLIFTHAGSIGQVSLIPKDSEYERYVISQRQFFLRPDLGKVSPAFLIYFFRSRNGQHILLSNASQVGVPSIARPSSHLKAIEVIVPTMDLMNSFEKKIDRIFALISQNRKQIQSLAETRDALLPKLLSGEMDVSALNFNESKNS